MILGIEIAIYIKLVLNVNISSNRKFKCVNYDVFQILNLYCHLTLI